MALVLPALLLISLCLVLLTQSPSVLARAKPRIAPCCASFRPSDDEAKAVVKSLDELFRSFCKGQRRDFFSSVSRHYELGITHLEDSFRRAHEENKNFEFRYVIENIRKRSAVVDVSIDWNMSYQVRKTGQTLAIRGKTHLALNRCRGFEFLGQKGSLLFSSF